MSTGQWDELPRVDQLSITEDETIATELSGRKIRELRRIFRRAIRRKLKMITPANSHPQLDSPLFGVLPPEIRNYIFELALSQYEDLDQPYRPTAYYYRPGLRAKPRIDTDLLLTCRRVYCETSPIPLRNATIYSWHDSERGPPLVPAKHLLNMLDRFTQKNLDEFYHAHLFVQMFNIEGGAIKYIFRNERFRPKLITMTFRHSDWWFWESDDPLRMVDWQKTVQLPPTCETFIIELETIERKKPQLDPIVERVKTWHFRTLSGHSLAMQSNPPKISNWVGHANLGDSAWTAVHGTGDTIKYHVVTLKFTRLPKEDETPWDGAEEESQFEEYDHSDYQEDEDYSEEDEDEDDGMNEDEVEYHYYTASGERLEGEPAS